MTRSRPLHAVPAKPYRPTPSTPPFWKEPAVAEHDWRMSAHCGPATAELFFPPEGETRAQREYREDAAKELCAFCPVKAACAAEFGQLLAAGPAHVDHPDRGIWAGTNYTDRTGRALRPRGTGAPTGPAPRLDPAALGRLTAARVPAAEIARRFGVTERTVQRTRARVRTLDGDGWAA